MAMNAEQLTDEIIAELEAAGFKPLNEHASGRAWYQAIAVAVVSHIQANATANVAGGSSAGSHPIT